MMKKLIWVVVAVLAAGGLARAGVGGVVTTGPGNSSSIAIANGKGTNLTIWLNPTNYVRWTNDVALGSPGRDGVWYRSTATNRHYVEEIFDDLAFNGGWTRLWNPFHSDQGDGGWAGEMQESGAAMALGMGFDSGSGYWKDYRRLQLGIGEYHHGWVDLQFDNQAKANDPKGYSIPLRWVTTYWNGAAAVFKYPTFVGETYDETTAKFGLTWYGDFDTTIPNGKGLGGTNMTGGTKVLRFRGTTADPGLDVFGKAHITNITTTAGTLVQWFDSASGYSTFPLNLQILGNLSIAAGEFLLTPVDHSTYFGYSTGADPNWGVYNGGTGTANTRLHVGAAGNYFNYGGAAVGRAAGPVFAETPFEVVGSVGISGAVMQTNMSSILAADITSVTATLASSGLTTTVLNAHKYRFHAILFVSDSTAADGVKIAFDGGAATITDFRCHALTGDTTLAAAVINTEPTALATTIGGALAGTGAVVVEVLGSITPSSSSTFIMRYAQNAHSTGTLTMRRGSSLVLTDIP